MKKILVIAIITIFSLSSFAETKVKLESLDGFSKEDSLRMELIARGVQKIINSGVFKQAVLSFDYNRTSGFADNNKKSNQEIYNEIMLGKEKLALASVNEWNMYFKLKFKFWIFSSVTAFTTDSTRVITFYSSYLRKAMDAEIAGTICHEQMHKLGFKHDQKATAKRPYTVPYGIGTICETLYVNLINEVGPVKSDLLMTKFSDTLTEGGIYAANTWGSNKFDDYHNGADCK